MTDHPKDDDVPVGEPAEEAAGGPAEGSADADYETLLRLMKENEELKDRALRDSRVRVVEAKRNLGFGRAQNMNIRAARGDVLLLLNQDVVLDPGFLARGIAVNLDRDPCRRGGREHRIPVGGDARTRSEHAAAGWPST